MKVTVQFEVPIDEDSDADVEAIIDRTYEAIENALPEATDVYVE